MKTLAILVTMALPAQAQHAIQWGSPWEIEAPAQAQAEDFRPEILMFSPDPCPLCDAIALEARDMYCPVQIVKRTLLPEMQSGPWFYFRTDQSSTGWYRFHGVHAKEGETPLEYVLRRWEEEGGKAEAECWSITVASLEPPAPEPEPPAPPRSSYPLNPQGWHFGSLGWNPSVSAMVDHLTGSPHSFERTWLESLTERELESLHDDDHEGRLHAPAGSMKRRQRVPAPVRYRYAVST